MKGSVDYSMRKTDEGAKGWKLTKRQTEVNTQTLWGKKEEIFIRKEKVSGK